MPLADDIRAKIEAGQTATATALRTLADQIERLPLRDAAEVLNWLSPHLERLRGEGRAAHAGRDRHAPSVERAASIGAQGLRATATSALLLRGGPRRPAG